jgi:hypothetical protein
VTPATSDLLQGLGVTLLVLGGAALASAVYQWRRADHAQSWPSVPGVVRHSSVKKGRSMFNMSRSGMGKGAVTYRAQVIYAYRVDGKPFEGRRVRFGAPKRDRIKSPLQDVVTRYPMNQPVQVHHNPGRPADAVLELGLDPFWRKTLGFGVVAVGLGLAIGAVSLLR